MGSLIKTLGVAGAALAAWYFLDPNKGAERRDKVARNARDLYDTTKGEVTRVGKDLAGGVTETVKSVSDGVGSLLSQSLQGAADGAAKAASGQGHS